MDAKYVFDSNIFIELQRRQPIDVYPTVWAKISELMEAGVIISSQEVYEEILAGNDNLTTWAKQREASFKASDEDIQMEVRSILAEHRGLVEGGKKKNNADPFVIALAKVLGCSVVSEEVRTNNQESPKIPDVCYGVGIPCLNFVGFSREMKLEF